MGYLVRILAEKNPKGVARETFLKVQFTNGSVREGRKEQGSILQANSRGKSLPFTHTQACQGKKRKEWLQIAGERRLVGVVALEPGM